MRLRKKRVPTWVVSLLSLLISLGATETGLRLFKEDSLKIRKDERNLTYRYDENLGWFPIENSKKSFKGSRYITVEHNSRGFRDSEHIIDSGPSIMFLGDSLLWGYDVEKPERFTEKLHEKLPEWSIYNLGVSGYGTDQEYLLLRQQFGYYKPSIVFLVFCTDNDQIGNTRNEIYRGYYKPYFTADGDSLTLKGVPVPKSKNYFYVRHDTLSKSYLFRLIVKVYFKVTAPPRVSPDDPTYAIINNIHSYVASKGSRFMVGLQTRNLELENFLNDHKIPYVDLGNPYRYPSHGQHWTPEGHAVVSSRIYEFLMNGGYLQTMGGPGQGIRADTESTRN